MAEDGELLTEGEIFKSQLRPVPEEGAEEQEDNSDTGASLDVGFQRLEVRQGVSPGQTLKPSKEGADGILGRDKRITL